VKRVFNVFAILIHDTVQTSLLTDGVINEVLVVHISASLQHDACFNC